MHYSHRHAWPIGPLLLASDGRQLAGLWMEGQKHFGGSGSLAGYAGGLHRKLRLLALEGVNTVKFLIPGIGTAL